MVELPGQTSIDLTPDVIAAMDEVQTHHRGFEAGKESVSGKDCFRGCPDPR